MELVVAGDLAQVVESKSQSDAGDEDLETDDVGEPVGGDVAVHEVAEEAQDDGVCEEHVGGVLAHEAEEAGEGFEMGDEDDAVDTEEGEKAVRA